MRGTGEVGMDGSTQLVDGQRYLLPSTTLVPPDPRLLDGEDGR